jgi:hypothetical protein
MSSGLSLFKPSVNSGLIAILSLIGFIAVSIVEAYKRPDYKDFTKDIELMKASIIESSTQVKEIKQDHSVLKMGAAFSRK